MNDDSSSDKVWESLAQSTPYWAVVSKPEFKGIISDEKRKIFFDEGVRQIEHALMVIRKHFDVNFAPSSSIDFGCGVGRMTLPLARASKRVFAVDVAPSMLKIAEQNCRAEGIQNVSFIQSDDCLSLLTEQVDFIFSTIVFQHIRPERGLSLLQRLISLLIPGGVIDCYVLYGHDSKQYEFDAEKVRQQPELLIEMNAYDVNRVFELFKEHGLTQIFCELCDMGSMRGMNIYARRS